MSIATPGGNKSDPNLHLLLGNLTPMTKPKAGGTEVSKTSRIVSGPKGSSQPAAGVERGKIPPSGVDSGTDFGALKTAAGVGPRPEVKKLIGEVDDALNQLKAKMSELEATESRVGELKDTAKNAYYDHASKMNKLKGRPAGDPEVVA